MIPDAVYIDVRTCGLTMSQMMVRIAELQEEHPDQEILMDGDLYAVVGRRRRTVTRTCAAGVRA